MTQQLLTTGAAVRVDDIKYYGLVIAFELKAYFYIPVAYL